MDPLTQGVLGGLVAQAGTKPDQIAKASIVGALSGMAADLDILIRSSNDPLLALEYHRHFTHSLLFVPIGALLCSLLFFLLLAHRWQLNFRQLYLWSLLGYGTHGLLDACTSYGTQLLWPFSNYRVAWDVISVVDPLFTLPLLTLVILAARSRRKRFTYWAYAWGSFYLLLGVAQHERALNMGQELALSRGHHPVRLEAKPSFANLLVWKVIYETEDHFFVDAVKPSITGSKSWSGESIRKLSLPRDLPWLHSDSIQARDLERFRWFSSGYIAQDLQTPTQIVDIRYSMLPHQIQPLWGINLDINANLEQPAEYFTQRNRSSDSLGKLLNMLIE